MGEKVEPGNGSSAHLVLTLCRLYHWRAARVHASEGPADMKASLYTASGEGLWLPAWTLMTGGSHQCWRVAQRPCGINQPPPAYHEAAALVQSKLDVAPNATSCFKSCPISFSLLGSMASSNSQTHFDSESRTEKHQFYKHHAVHEGGGPVSLKGPANPQGCESEAERAETLNHKKKGVCRQHLQGCLHGCLKT